MNRKCKSKDIYPASQPNGTFVYEEKWPPLEKAIQEAVSSEGSQVLDKA